MYISMTCDNCVLWCSFNFLKGKVVGLDASSASSFDGTMKSWTDEWRTKALVGVGLVFSLKRNVHCLGIKCWLYEDKETHNEHFCPSLMKVKPVKPWTQRQECCTEDCKGRAGLQINVDVLTVISTEVLVASIKDFLWMWGNNFVFCFVFSPQQNIPSTDDPTRKNNRNNTAFCSLVWTCVSRYSHKHSQLSAYKEEKSDQYRNPNK